MKTYDRIPRNLMRVRLRELHVGEGTWISEHDVHITEDGRVFVSLEHWVWDVQHDGWAKELQNGRFRVERTETGWRFHVLSRDTIPASHSDLDKERRDDHARAEVVVHADEDQVCPACQGAGITNLKGNALHKHVEEKMPTPWKTLQRIEALLASLKPEAKP